jgi:microcin C transport system ATP-binding protein
MNLLSVNNLSVSAGASALVNGVSFAIQKGEILALVGESGSGKTLTALSIMGLLADGLQQRGTIQYSQTGDAGGQGDWQTLVHRLRGSRIGMIFQEPMTSLNPLHTVSAQIAEAVRMHNRWDKKRVHARVLELLGKVGLGYFKDRLDAYPHQLSGGERQRVMIAMAIANNPALLIADEPTTALDVTVQAQILALLKDLQCEMGMAVLLITHDLTIVRKIATRVAIMSQGSIVETDSTQTVFAAPKHAYTQHLLASEHMPAQAAADTGAPVLLEGRGITVSFDGPRRVLGWKKKPQEVLHGVNLRVASGQTLGIVGESGSGKTTLALALLRLMASSGEIVFDGAHLEALRGKALRAKRRDMQIVFQDPYGSLNPRMTIGHIIREGLDVHEPTLTVQQRAARMVEALREVGMTQEMEERYPHEFSGGQRQRISIARALIVKPKLIVLDEPTSALDVTIQAQILALLKDLQKRHGLTYLFISHDLRVIRAISHHVLVLEKGQVVEQGSAQEIFTAPKQPYTKALLAAAFG